MAGPSDKRIVNATNQPLKLYNTPPPHIPTTTLSLTSLSHSGYPYGVSDPMPVDLGAGNEDDDDHEVLMARNTALLLLNNRFAFTPDNPKRFL